MADLWSFQSNLNRGELDPLLFGRRDLQAYYNGVATGKNVLSIPQGGMKKRPGTKHINTALGNGRTERFSFNVEQEYLLVFTALKMEIYKDGVLQTNISGSGNDYLTIPWTLAQIQEFDYIQSADTIIITHEDVESRKITRTSDTAWTISTLGLTNVPQFDYNDASSPTPTAEIQRLNFANQNEGDRYKLSLEGILTDEITFAGEDDTNEENIRIALQGLFTTGNTGISVAVVSALDTYDVTFAGESANDWDLLTAAAVFTQSASFNVATTRQQTGVARKEDVWSATRGWPRTCTFHEGRLWFGGSKSLPSTLWGSKVFYVFDFDAGRALDDEAVSVTLETDQVNAVEAIFSNRALQVFTSGGEFYFPESPITPSSRSVLPQTNLGAKRVRPVTIDGVTLFVQRTGKAIIQFVFLDEFKSNQAQSVSVSASHLIDNPVQMAASRGTEASDANYVYVVNTGGDLAVYNTLAVEDVSGFTNWETAATLASAGSIKSVAVVDKELYLLVEREINGSTVYLIEKEDITLNTDSSVLDTTNDNEITGLGHLEGETVWAKADGAFQGAFTVSGGKITLTRTSSDKEAGLSFVPTIKTMPLNIQLQNGPNAASKKKIARIAVNMYESNGIIVNGERLADKTLGVDQFDAPDPFTGIKRIHTLGWSLEAQVTLTQTTPMPMTLLSIGTEVKT